VRAFLKPALLMAAALVSVRPAVAQFSMETVQQMRMDQLNGVVQSSVPGQAAANTQNLTCAAGGVELPAGWTVASTQNGMATLKMAGSDDVALIGVLPSADAEKIVTAVVMQVSPTYSIRESAPVKRLANGVVQGGAILRFMDGREAFKLVIAQVLPNGTTAMASLISSDAKNPQRLQTKSTALAGLMQQLIAGRQVPGARPVLATSPTPPSVGSATPEKPLSVINTGRPAPRGVALDTVGGTFEPGKYVGSSFYKNHGETKADNMKSMTLYLFDNGEYMKSDDDKYGNDYTVNPATGALDLDYGQSLSFYNSTLNPGEDVALYGRYQGKAAVYGRSDRGYGNYYVLLVREGPVGRLSPKQRDAKTAAAEAEAKRYKYTTAWGKGTGAASVANVLFKSTSKQFYNGVLNYSESYDVFVLFRDGSFHEEFPVPLEAWDAATAKRRDAKRWGRWRAAGGGKYLLTFSDGKSLQFSGQATRPARIGEMLSGQYGNGSTSGNLMGGSYSLRYITFKGNRFEIDESGGYGSSTFSQSVPGNAAINTTTNNGDSFTSVTGGNFVVGTGRKGKGSARTGSYQLNGYTLRLQFDDGRVTWQPFFFIGDTDVIWYNDELRAKS
jgi:hypothetical protein